MYSVGGRRILHSRAKRLGVRCFLAPLSTALGYPVRKDAARQKDPIRKRSRAFLEPQRGAIPQPRAAPWVYGTQCIPSPVGAVYRPCPIVSLFRPSRARISFGIQTQGVALGYGIPPLWGYAGRQSSASPLSTGRLKAQRGRCALQSALREKLLLFHLHATLLRLFKNAAKCSEK